MSIFLGTPMKKSPLRKQESSKRELLCLQLLNEPDALGVIEKQADKMSAPIYKINRDFTVGNHTSLPKGERFSLKWSSGTLEALDTSLIGEHQTENAALAVMAALYLNEHHLCKLDEHAIRTGLTQAYWPGRFEIVSENPLVVLDGAHNDEGITALVHELTQRYHDQENSYRILRNEG